MTFPEFVERYLAGTLDVDAGWRGHDIPAAIKPNHATKALKKLGLTYAGELALPEFCARYPQVPKDQATRLLACWYLWAMVDEGRVGYWKIARRKTAKAG